MRAILIWMLMTALALSVGCGGDRRPGRERYNEGLSLLAKADHAAAQKAFLAARDQAGVDPELRYRAAFNLASSLTAEADAAKAADDGDPAKAIALYQQAISWFGDALRIRKGDVASTNNLAIVTARAKALEDQLAQDQNRLEAKLDAVIEAQRGVLESSRGAWQAIKQASTVDPLAEQAALTQSADTQRGIAAEAGVVADVAAIEIEGIGKKAEDKRTDEEKVRIVQLKNLDLYLMEARSRMAEARKRLQELAAESGAERSEAALVALKRAREQLLDPVAALRGIAQDQLELLRDASALEPQLSTTEAAPVRPVWLTASALAGRQQPLVDRLQEVESRLRAGLETKDKAAAQPSAVPSSPIGMVPNAQTAPLAAPTPTPTPSAPSPAAADPQAAQQEKMLARVRAAMPLLVEAVAAMQQAREDLTGDRGAAAVPSMQRAVMALSKAIELFADLKQTIELAWREQKTLLSLLGAEAAKQLPAKTRATETRASMARNLDRLTRLRELLIDARAEAASKAASELAKVDAAAAAAAAAPPPPAGAAGAAADPAAAQAVAAARAQAQQVEAQFNQAESLREQAAVALVDAQRSLGTGTDPEAKAKEADGKIEELRRIFFDIVEHLQELIRTQAETKDKTQAAVGKDQIELSSLLPAIIERQSQHRQMDQSIDAALAKQADQAAAAGPQGAEQQKKFAAAAEEMRLAGIEMDRASGTLIAARDQTGGKSYDLKPVPEAQTKAGEHLQAALQILQPPQPQKNDKQQEQQQQEQQKQQQQQQQQQGGATQSARDQDAKRQRQRDRDNSPQPVDKDW